jgi:hypothetical protein
MNHAPGSTLQKVSFILVLFIAAAAGYLVVRERLRASQQRKAEAEAAVATNSSQSTSTPERPTSPSAEKPNYAPLRDRVETNVVRVPSNRFIGVPGSTNYRTVIAGHTTSQGTMQISAGIPTETPVVVGGGSASRGGAASIAGRVFLRGTPPPEKAITMDAACAALQPAPMTTRHYVVGEDGALADVFVYIKTGVSPTPAPTRSIPPLLDQVNCEYQQYVIGVQTGQTLNVRNSDNLLHNVHVLPIVPRNRERNIGQPVKGMVTRLTFEKPEIFVQFKCDVHPWMFAYVGVMEHPWFAVTDKQGNFALAPELAPGQYTVCAVHRKAGEQVQTITVGSSGRASATFTLEIPAP